MEIHYRNSYTSKKGKSAGQVRHAYSVVGTPAELAAYKKARGTFYVEDEKGVPVHTTGFSEGQRANIVITKDGNVAVDRSEANNMKALIDQNPGQVGQVLAEAYAAKLLANLPKAGSQVSVATGAGIGTL